MIALPLLHPLHQLDNQTRKASCSLLISLTNADFILYGNDIVTMQSILRY